MGYTHYWKQSRNFTRAQWKQVSEDIGEILKDVQHNQGIELANGMGEPGTSPEFTDDHIHFNGLGDDSHETMAVCRKRIKTWEGGRFGWDFCKTARKPYDLAVTAVLCYLSTVTRKDIRKDIVGAPVLDSETHHVTSDGRGADFLDGLEEARRALPRYANLIDLPMDVMRDDRWCAPWISQDKSNFQVRFCVDGKGYIIRTKTREAYCFSTHLQLAEYLRRTQVVAFARGGHTGWGSYPRIEENIWNATGCFDKERHARIRRAQESVLKRCFPVPVENNLQPPAFVRPGDFPPDAGREFCYGIEELLKLQDAA